MNIGIGINNITEIMNSQYSLYRAQLGVDRLSEEELSMFDIAIPELLSNIYKERLSTLFYATYVSNYLVGLMRAKNVLGGLPYSGNDSETGIVSREITADMFLDASGVQKTRWMSQPSSAGWQAIIGQNSSTGSVISHDGFGAMVISHVDTLGYDPNVLEILYYINQKPRISQYVEPAFLLNDNRTYQFDMPIMATKNTRVYVEANVETANQPVALRQCGVVFADAGWMNTHSVSMS